jgi:hypothetical protein
MPGRPVAGLWPRHPEFHTGMQVTMSILSEIYVELGWGLMDMWSGTSRWMENFTPADIVYDGRSSNGDAHTLARSCVYESLGRHVWFLNMLVFVALSLWTMNKWRCFSKKNTHTQPALD